MDDDYKTLADFNIQKESTLTYYICDMRWYIGNYISSINFGPCYDDIQPNHTFCIKFWQVIFQETEISKSIKMLIIDENKETRVKKLSIAFDPHTMMLFVKPVKLLPYGAKGVLKINNGACINASKIPFEYQSVFCVVKENKEITEQFNGDY